MKRFVTIFFALLFVASCSKDELDDVDQELNPAQITLMYFAGIDLNRYYDNNIANAKAAVANGSLGDYGVLYYFLPETTSDATLFEISYEDGVCVEREVMIYTDIASLTPEALVEVWGDVKADVGYTELLLKGDVEMNMIWSSHSTGWVVNGDGTKSTSNRDLSLDNRRNLSVDEKFIPTRFFGLESSSSEGVMDVEDLCQAIEDSDLRLGYILFDACLMSSVEALYRLREVCDYVVASPAEILAAGFPYESVIANLFEDGGKSYNLEAACQSYYDYYANSYATVAMCVTSELEALAAAMSKITLDDLTSTQRSQIQSYDGLSNHVFFDLGNYVEVAGGTDSNFAAFQAQFDKAFPEECRFCTSKLLSNLPSTRSSYVSINNYTGVSTSQPSINTTYNGGWSDEPWAMAIDAE